MQDKTTRFSAKAVHFALSVMFATMLLSTTSYAQTTVFSFEASLPNSFTPATGTFEMEFRLFDAPTAGNQIGTTNVIGAVDVQVRQLTVWLDFGAAAFPGANRFIEISYRQKASHPFTTLEYREPVLSVPYAIRALNATHADNVTGFDPGDFVQTTDPRLSDSRDPNPGSNHYIQNTTTLQTPAHFNISGNGAADTFNAAIQYSIASARVLAIIGTNNVFAGVNAGSNNTTGSANAFFGKNAGQANTTGSSNLFAGNNTGAGNTVGRNNTFVGDAAGLVNAGGNNNSFLGFLAGSNNTGTNNAFFGSVAGLDNTTAGGNSFFGAQSGLRNTTGRDNAFFGQRAGEQNLTADSNSFFGGDSGATNTTGSANSFLGFRAGYRTLTGSNNVFLGRGAGDLNTTGGNNTALGTGANLGSNNLNFATAIGAGSVVNASNTLVLGRALDTVEVPGALNVTGTFGANILNAATQFNIGGSRILSSPGINNLFGGTNSGAANTTGNANAFYGKNAGQANTTGSSNSFVGYNSGAGNTTGRNNSFFGDAAGFVNAGGSDNAFFGFLSGFHNVADRNAFFGSLAGANNTTGGNNSFFGGFAGQNNLTGGSNSFFGFVAGLNNQASSNSFFGRGAGFTNTTGTRNSFFGTNASDQNNTGSDNSSFGFNSGKNNFLGNNNSFFGSAAGFTNSNGNNITVVGAGADVVSANLKFASAFGSRAVVSTDNTIVIGKVAGTYDSVVRPADTVQIPGALNVSGTVNGSGLIRGVTVDAVTQFNLAGSIVLRRPGLSSLYAGSQSGAPGVSGSQNSFFGDLSGVKTTVGSGNSYFGFWAGGSTIAGNDNTAVGRRAGITTTGNGNSFFGSFSGGNGAGPGSNNTFIGANTDIAITQHVGSDNTLLGANAKVDPITNGNDLRFATAIGAGARIHFSNMIMLGKAAGIYDGVARPADIVRTAGIFQPALASPGGSPVCFNNGISLCSSSYRYKTAIQPFFGGLNVVKQLMPITFSWTDDGRPGVGFGAEDVEKIEPLLTFRNDKGQIEGVHYAEITTVLVNAVKEQQKQIEELGRQVQVLKKRLSQTTPQRRLARRNSR